MRLSRAVHLILLAALLVGCAPTAPAAAESPLTTLTASLVDGLRHGGLYIVLRHGADTGKDNLNVDPADCANQGALTDAGRQELSAMGASIASLSLPIGDVLASPYCRTLETARIVFGKAVASDLLVRPPGGAPLANDDPRLAAIKRMLAAIPATGTDMVLVTHSQIMRAVFGLDAVLGESVIVQPKVSGGYVILARIGVRGWKRP